jgi:hypothetical protein
MPSSTDPEMKMTDLSTVPRLVSGGGQQMKLIDNNLLLAVSRLLYYAKNVVKNFAGVAP